LQTPLSAQKFSRVRAVKRDGEKGKKKPESGLFELGKE